MLKFFDYIYYRTYKLHIPGCDAAFNVATVQALNIITLLYFLFPTFWRTHSVLFYIFWGGIWIILSILNGVFTSLLPLEIYFKRIRKCEAKWDNESKKIKRLKGILVIIYYLASIIAFVLAIIHGK